VNNAKQSRLAYQKRKASGRCTIGGCPEKAEAGHTHCRKHSQKMCEESRQRYQERSREALCVYCGERPRFHGVRCMICRQKFAKDPLPFGVRRTLRHWREAEKRRAVEQSQVEARFVARKLLASGDIKGKRAEALRLYAGIDNGKWRTYSEVGQLMQISKERVRQLLRPSKVTVARMLNDRVPWRSMPKDSEGHGKISSSAQPGPIHCCASPVARIDQREPYPYESLPEVVLIGVSIYRCDNCQTEATIIPHQQDLDRALGERVLLKPASMTGRELRFLRTASQLTIEAMSELLGVSRGTLIAWEAAGALRYTNDLAARVVIASIDQKNGFRLIHQILKSVRIGNMALDPIRARWSDVEERWIIESAVL